jgi:hypothetical protein
VIEPERACAIHHSGVEIYAVWLEVKVCGDPAADVVDSEDSDPANPEELTFDHGVYIVEMRARTELVRACLQVAFAFSQAIS